MLKSLLCTALISFSFLLSAQNLKLNLDKAEISFYFHGDKVDGSLKGLEADIQINISDLKKTKIKGSVDVSTIKTGITMRDKHLISKDFFHAKEYPKMTFQSEQIEVKDDVMFIDGTLTIKSTQRKERLELRVKDNEIVFTGRINTADYDVMTKKKREKTEVDVTIKIPKA